jgi:4-diphosphocytidyl-2-C-methyl-D-erythritol kinase
VIDGGVAQMIRRRAPAKINLFLHVVGRREDGFHLLDSLVAFTDYGDDLAVAPAREISLAIDGPFARHLPAGDDNLVLRAARRLQAACGVSDGAQIRLTKNLPVASGIGGGSADAAAALAALAELWGANLPADRLASLGLELGADLPVCLAGRASFVGGIGEKIDPAPPMADLDILLVNPLVPLPTVDVFRRRAAGPEGARFGAPGRWSAPVADEALCPRLAECRNDLTDAAIALVPEIDAVLSLIAGSSGCRLARLSGSGATCFGLYSDRGAAEAAAAAILKGKPGWWSVATRLRLSGTRDSAAEGAVARR